MGSDSNLIAKHAAYHGFGSCRDAVYGLF